MTDLSALSDDQLKAMYAPHAAAAAAPDLSKMSDEDLKALHASMPPKESLGSDLAKSTASGLASATAGTLGALGDARSLLSGATDWAGGKLGVDPEKVQSLKNVVSAASHVVPGGDLLANAPTSRDIIKSAPDPIVSPDYKPQTTGGAFLKTGAEFLPGAFLGGGEGLLARLGTRVAAPAVASETAGQLTKDTALEPYARIGGAVLGGAGASKLASTLSQASKAALPTVDELKASYRAGISHPDVKAVTFEPQSLADLHNTIRSDLETKGFRARREGNTFSDVDELVNPAPTAARAAGAPATIDDVESVRKSLGKTAQEVGPDFRPTSDAAAASAAVKHVDNWLDNLKQPDLLSGDISKAAPILKNARGDYAAAMRADTIQKKIGNAALQAGSSYSGGNINNATRQALKPLAKNDFAKAGGYSDAEKDQLAKAILGNVAGNTARAAGKLAPDSGWKALEHLALALKTGGASIPFSAGSLAAKVSGDYATRRNVRNLDEMLRARSPLAQQTMGPPLQAVGQGRGKTALVNALLASTSPRLYVAPIPQMPQIAQPVAAPNQ